MASESRARERLTVRMTHGYANTYFNIPPEAALRSAASGKNMNEPVITGAIPGVAVIIGSELSEVGEHIT